MYKVTTSKTFSEGKSISENRYSASDMTKKKCQQLVLKKFSCCFDKNASLWCMGDEERMRHRHSHPKQLLSPANKSFNPSRSKNKFKIH
jgi:hypothetical protein